MGRQVEYGDKARAGSRGPSVLQRRADEEAARAAEEEQRAKKHKARRSTDAEQLSTGVAPPPLTSPAPVKFGRVGLHSAPKWHSGDGTGQERRTMLMAKGWCRRTLDVHGVGPSGDADFDAESRAAGSAAILGLTGDAGASGGTFDGGGGSCGVGAGF